MGASGLSFLMHLWNPTEYAVSNASTERAIRTLKITFGRRISVKRGQGLNDRTEVIRFIARMTGLKTFSAVDHFLDAIAKKHIK
jgi:hypothetical protein